MNYHTPTSVNFWKVRMLLLTAGPHGLVLKESLWNLKQAPLIEPSNFTLLFTSCFRCILEAVNIMQNLNPIV